MACPIKRELYLDGWKLKQLGNRDFSALLGTGFALGMAAWKTGRQDPHLIARAYVSQETDQWVERGHSIPDWEEGTVSRLPDLVEKAVLKQQEQDPIPSTWTILDVEKTLDGYGPCRLDLGVHDGLGPAVVDYKLKRKLEARYVEKEIRKYKDSWQQYHYCWAYGQYRGEEVSRFYINLVILEPRFSTTLYPFIIRPECMKRWIESAEAVWRLMERNVLWQASRHSDEYGECEYYKACFDHMYHEHLMERDYLYHWS